jgi:hypothetical protein
MPKDLTCATCAHFKLIFSHPDWRSYGDCRLKAPTRALVDGNGDRSRPGEPHWGVWPAVSPHDWCGEHKHNEAI